MDLLSRLQDDMKTALKAGEKERLGVIRMILRDVKNRDLMPGKPSEQQVVEAYAKKLRKAQEEFAKIGNTTEVDKLKKELQITESYLPTKASPQQTEALLDAFLQGKTFTEKQFGQAMGAFLKAHGSDVDPAVASQLLRARLAGKA